MRLWISADVAGLLTHALAPLCSASSTCCALLRVDIITTGSLALPTPVRRSAERTSKPVSAAGLKYASRSSTSGRTPQSQRKETASSPDAALMTL